MQSYKDIDEYIKGFPVDVQENLGKIRNTIKETVPEATENISYGIPTFVFHGNLVHFAAYDTHYGFYPGAIVANFPEELKEYKTSKGTVQFPIDKPVPLDLIALLTKAATQRNIEKKKR
jgi:uncharacterized protein YdhG (YjbR/CyaY superfamily)